MTGAHTGEQAQPEYQPSIPDAPGSAMHFLNTMLLLALLVWGIVHSANRRRAKKMSAGKEK